MALTSGNSVFALQKELTNPSAAHSRNIDELRINLSLLHIGAEENCEMHTGVSVNTDSTPRTTGEFGSFRNKADVYIAERWYYSKPPIDN